MRRLGRLLGGRMPEFMIWLLPVLLPLVALGLRWSGGEPMEARHWIAIPLVGTGCAAYCHTWLLFRRRKIDGELARRKRELEASQLFLAEVVDRSPGALVISDRRGTVTFASRAAEALVGSARGCLVGTHVSSLYVGGAAAARDTGRKLGSSGGWLAGHRTDLRTVDGRTIPVEISATYLHLPTGEPDAVLAVVQDLTERLAAEKRALEAERLRVLGESIAGIAHELNNPLTGVIGYLQYAIDEGPPSELDEPLRKAAREAERMARTIKALLAFGRRRAPERQPADLAEIARQVKDFREYQLRVAGIAVEVTGDVMPPISVDHDQVRQMLMNLVKNAEDAIRDSEVGGRIVIRTRIGDGVLRVEVEDDGPGVVREFEPLIFEHFFTTKPPGKGTGLGLAICRQIMSAHGGCVFHERPEGGGARFVLEFPARIEDCPAPEPAARPAPAAAGSLRALVVDDEEAVRDYVGTVLRGEGHSVFPCATAGEAILRAETEVFDLALVDRGLPDLRGEECRAELVARRPGLRGRVILMSGDVPEDGGGSLFLLKPMTVDEIRESISRAFR